MKKNFICLSITGGLALLISCSAPKYQVFPSVVNYRTYLETDNFYITESNSVAFDYEPVGNITVRILNGKCRREYAPGDIDTIYHKGKDYNWYEFKPKEGAKPIVDFEPTLIHGKDYDYYDPNYRTGNYNDVLDELYKQAKSIGANGIINLKLQPYQESVTKRDGVMGTAMAIKKK